ncbi:MAG: hypothetical protein RIF36_02725 [Imperialibacter sp.]|uniref:hypothetical protein n=1 Tax=Imperialibacter sp. TaxID=2038411 RepID=UPI0032EEEF1C
MIIERKDNEIIFRLPGDTDIDDLQAVVDWLKFREISRKSKATQEQIDELAREAKKGRWEKTKSILGL